jgi:hypothetical protein
MNTNNLYSFTISYANILRNPQSFRSILTGLISFQFKRFRKFGFFQKEFHILWEKILLPILYCIHGLERWTCLNLILELTQSSYHEMRNKECSQSLKVFCSTSHQGITFTTIWQPVTNNDFIRKTDCTYFIEVQMLTKAQVASHLSYI